MEISVGNDIVDINRFKKKIMKDGMMKNIFLPSEMKNKDAKHLAGLFAGKEAVTKALGLKPGKWLDIEILQDRRNKPIINVSSELEKHISSYSLSISHDGEYAMATVVVLLK